MNDANSRQVALQNLREFQEMSYSDVYALIRQKRFDEAKAKYIAVLESMGVEQFSAALNLNISTSHDTLLECMSGMASTVAEPEKIRAVGFDLSAHAIYHDQNGRISQGIEVSLYSEDVYDFANASDEQIRMQCESASSEWQGAFMEIESCGLEGLGPIAQQFIEHTQNQNNLQGIIESENGQVIVDPIAIARHVAKLLVAIEYHRYMADFVAEVEVPSKMVFIIGEHDEIEVPILFYRVGEDQSADVQPVEPVAEPQELAHEETPALYLEEDQVGEAPTVEEEPENTNLGSQLYEQTKAQSDEIHIAEPALEHIEEQEIPVPDIQDLNEDKSAGDETTDEEPVSSAKALLGTPLKPKTFGQRSNKIFGEDTDKEESA